MTRPLLAGAVTLAAALLVACGGSGSRTTVGTTGSTTTSTTPPTATSTPPPTTTTTTAPLTPRGGIDTLAGASARPVHVTATNTQIALLTAVRASRHEGFDRVVFEFRNALPGYDVGYVSGPIRNDPSGKIVPIAGAAMVRIRMDHALDADLTRPSAPMTYTGPQRMRPGTPEIAELARTGSFEGVLTWVAGLQDRVDFRVTTLTAPARLVVDFRNH